MKNKLQEVICMNCGVIRIAEIDLKESGREGRFVAIKTCPVCHCPYIKIKEIKR